jgi:hypothetical protein
LEKKERQQEVRLASEVVGHQRQLPVDGSSQLNVMDSSLSAGRLKEVRMASANRA